MLQLQIGGDIALHRLGGVGIGSHGSLAVFGGHGVAPAPVGVAADRHIVGVEGLAVVDIVLNIGRRRQLHHLQIRVGPAGAGDVQTIALTVVIIAQIGVGQVAVIIGVGVVVIGHGGVAQRTELVAQREGHIVLGADVEAEVVVDPCGDHPGHGGKFTAGGGLSPAGLVVIGKHKALVGQLVQGGRQFLADDIGGKGLGGDLDQVLAGEHAGIFVFLAGGDAAEILVDILQRLAAHQLRRGLKIQIHFVVIIDHRRWIRLRLDHFHHRRFGHAQQGILRLQPHGGGQAEAGDRPVGDKIIGVVRPVFAGIAQRRARYLTHRKPGQRQQPYPAAEPLARQQTAAEHDQRRQRQEGQQDKGQPGKDDLHHGGEEIAHHLAGHLGHEAQGEIRLEITLAAVFDARQHRPRCAQNIGHHMGGFSGQHVHQGGKQQPRRGGKQRDIHKRQIPEGNAAVKNMQQQLMIDKRHGEEKQWPQTVFGRGLWHFPGCQIFLLHKSGSPFHSSGRNEFVNIVKYARLVILA